MEDTDKRYDVKPLNMEKAFLKRFLYLGLLGAFIILIFDVFLNPDPLFVILDAIFVVVFVIFIYLLNKAHLNLLGSILIFFLSINITIQYFVAAGWGEEIISAILIAFGVFASLALKGVYKIVLICGIFIMIVSVWIGLLFDAPPEAPEAIFSELQRFLPYVLIYWVLVIPISMLKDQYISQQQSLGEAHVELQEKTEEINIKHQELLASHEALIALNKKLEDNVAAKTGDIMQQNKRLSEYAFAHAHIVRAHTARLAGLFNLMQLDRTSKAIYWEKIQTEVLEMDKTIKKLGDILYAEDEGEGNGDTLVH